MDTLSSISTTITIPITITTTTTSTSTGGNALTSSISTEESSPPHQAAYSSNKFNKFGKKAWILEYQRETTNSVTTPTSTTSTTVTPSSNTTSTTSATTPPPSNSVPFKKKFLDNYLSTETPTISNNSNEGKS